MGNKKITGRATLAMQIALVKAERARHEEVLTQSYNELTQLIFYPAQTFREELSENRNAKREFIKLTKIAMNMGTDYLIEQSFGKKQKMSDFLTSRLIEIISIPLINKGISKVFSIIDRQLFREP